MTFEMKRMHSSFFGVNLMISGLVIRIREDLVLVDG